MRSTLSVEAVVAHQSDRNGHVGGSHGLAIGPDARVDRAPAALGRVGAEHARAREQRVERVGGPTRPGDGQRRATYGTRGSASKTRNQDKERNSETMCAVQRDRVVRGKERTKRDARYEGGMQTCPFVPCVG